MARAKAGKMRRLPQLCYQRLLDKAKRETSKNHAGWCYNRKQLLYFFLLKCIPRRQLGLTMTCMQLVPMSF